MNQMKRLWPLIFIIGSTLGVLVSLILVSLTVWLEAQPSSQVLTLPDVKVQYVEQLTPIEQSLSALIDGDLSAQDSSALSSLRFKLLNLTVPPEAKEFHMSLIFKLQQLEDLLSKSAPLSELSIDNLRSDLKTLVTNNQW